MIRRLYSVLSNHKGFTLIELVTVSAIIVVIMGALYSTYFSGFQAYKFNSDQAACQQSARAAVQRIVYEAGKAKKVEIDDNKLKFEKQGVETIFEVAYGTLSLGGQPVADNIKDINFSGTSNKFLKMTLTTAKGDSEYTVRTAVYIDENTGKGKK